MLCKCRFFITLLIAIYFQNNLYAQSAEEMLEEIFQHQVVEIRDSIIIKAYIINNYTNNVRVKSNRFYNSFYAGKFIQTQGGIYGKLLDGTYEEIYTETNTPKAQGIIKNGLKVGVWNKWYPDGFLIQREFYRKGKQKGRFVYYFPMGIIKESGKKKNGYKTGVAKQYSTNGVVCYVKYKKGIIVWESNKRWLARHKFTD